MDMGFNDQLVKLAFHRSTVKTLDGVLEYIEKTPGLEADSQNEEIMNNLEAK